MSSVIKKSVVEVFEGLYLGTWSDEYNIETMNKLNISHLLVCGSEIEPTHTKSNLIYLKLPLLDFDSFKIDKYLDEATSFMEKALVEGTGLFIYSFKAKRRAIAMLLAFVMKLWQCDYTRSSYKLNKKGIATNQVELLHFENSRSSINLKI